MPYTETTNEKSSEHRPRRRVTVASLRKKGWRDGYEDARTGKPFNEDYQRETDFWAALRYEEARLVVFHLMGQNVTPAKWSVKREFRERLAREWHRMKRIDKASTKLAA